MTDAWHEVRQAVRALRKGEDIRVRLMEAYRTLVKIKGKDLPHEVRHHHEWLIRGIGTRSAASIHAEIREVITGMAPAELSEAVHRIAVLHDALRAYQPAIFPTPQKQAACRALQSKAGPARQDRLACVDCTQCQLF